VSKETELELAESWQPEAIISGTLTTVTMPRRWWQRYPEQSTHPTPNPPREHHKQL